MWRALCAAVLAGGSMVPASAAAADDVRVLAFHDPKIIASSLVDFGRVLVTANDSGHPPKLFAVNPVVQPNPTPSPTSAPSASPSASASPSVSPSPSASSSSSVAATPVSGSGRKRNESPSRNDRWLIGSIPAVIVLGAVGIGLGLRRRSE